MFCLKSSLHCSQQREENTMIDSYRAQISERISEASTPAVILRRPINKLGTMNLLRLAAFSLLVCATGYQTYRAFAETSHAASDPGAQTAATARDGEHDFDFNIGVWHTHIRR